MTEGSLSLLASFLKINYFLFTYVPQIFCEEYDDVGYEDSFPIPREKD